MEDHARRMSFMHDTRPRQRVAIVGAGMAGLTCAFYLNKAGFDVRLYEKNSRVGGLVKTNLKEKKYLIECGPHSYPSNSDSVARLSRELSLDRVELKSSASERLVYSKKRLSSFPKGLFSIVKSPLLSPVAKARLLYEPFVRTKSQDGETLANFIRRRAGDEILKFLVDPYISGTQAGNVEELELRSTMPSLYHLESRYGSIFKGLIKNRRILDKSSLVSYKWGMNTLPARLEELLRQNTKLETEIKDVLYDEFERIFLSAGDPPRRFEVDAVVIATNAVVASELLKSTLPDVSLHLKNIEYAPIAVVHTAYKQSSIANKRSGYGTIIPRAANIRILGTTFSSALFPNRAPDDEVLLTTYIGGTKDPDAVDLDDEEILKEVRKGIYETLDISAKPVFSKIKRFKYAIPQYTSGHYQKIKNIEDDLLSVPGLYITGNYFSGFSIADTIEHARSVSEDVKRWLARPKIKKVLA